MQKLQTSTIIEFEKLKDRLRKSEEYFANKFENDTSENQLIAQDLKQSILKRMSVLWEQMSLTLELDPDKTADKQILEIMNYSEQFLYPVRIVCYTKSVKAIVKLEPPTFWKDTVTRIEVDK